jgi:Aldo/keto reductase family
MNLTSFRTLGRSGLIVSPLALGTMTFGTQRWGSPDDVSASIFNAYIEAGGNFIDTADVYASGRSEERIGGYIGDRNLRDRLVLATKFSFYGSEPGNPNAGGNGRKNIHRALEGSLRRLKTDYIDLYWMHVWDMVTPIEEVLQSLGDLVRTGKIRYLPGTRSRLLHSPQRKLFPHRSPYSWNTLSSSAASSASMSPSLASAGSVLRLGVRWRVDFSRVSTIAQVPPDRDDSAAVIPFRGSSLSSPIGTGASSMPYERWRHRLIVR